MANEKQKRSNTTNGAFCFKPPEPENEAQALFEVLRLAAELTKAIQTLNKYKTINETRRNKIQ